MHDTTLGEGVRVRADRCCGLSLNVKSLSSRLEFLLSLPFQICALREVRVSHRAKKADGDE